LVARETRPLFTYLYNTYIGLRIVCFFHVFFKVLSILRSEPEKALWRLRRVPGAFRALLATSAVSAAVAPAEPTETEPTEPTEQESQTPPIINVTSDRIRVPDFCLCGRCSFRSRGLERRCCRSERSVCTLESEDFKKVVDPVVVRTAVNSERNAVCEDRWQYDNVNMRHTAYRQFVYLVAGNVGLKRRLIIPSCVTWFIKSTWPSEDDVYTGFKAAQGSGSAVLCWTVDNGIATLGGRVLAAMSNDNNLEASDTESESGHSNIE
jgi:hypothetical protein